MFISFEGLDYCGKSTQATMLVKRLESAGKKVLLLREPGGTEISEKIRTILLDVRHAELNSKAELFLFSAARTQLVSQVIRPSIEKGTIIICDRFVDSTTAYQGYGRGIDLSEITSINSIATGGTMPSLTVFISVEIEEILKRRTASKGIDRMEASDRAFYERVHSGFLSIAANEPQRVRTIDGMKAINSIHEEIWNLVQQYL